MNYPPGVTGNEPEIAGYPETEAVEEGACRDCPFWAEVTITTWTTPSEICKTWTCPECGSEQETREGYDPRDFD